LIFNRTPEFQGGMQFVGYLVSLVIGSGSGVGMGFLLRLWRVFYLP